MSEKIQDTESVEILPSEEQIIEVMRGITRGKAFVETRRAERGGKLRELEVRLVEPGEDGNMVQLDYTVDHTGTAVIDATYYNPSLGYDYRPGMGYDPQDIVGGTSLGKFESGVWQEESSL